MSRANIQYHVCWRLLSHRDQSSYGIWPPFIFGSLGIDSSSTDHPATLLGFWLPHLHIYAACLGPMVLLSKTLAEVNWHTKLANVLNLHVLLADVYWHSMSWYDVICLCMSNRHCVYLCFVYIQYVSKRKWLLSMYAPTVLYFWLFYCGMFRAYHALIFALKTFQSNPDAHQLGVVTTHSISAMCLRGVQLSFIVSKKSIESTSYHLIVRSNWSRKMRSSVRRPSSTWPWLPWLPEAMRQDQKEITTR